ncbi:MAG TPA: hypothetical protein VE287_02835, partial [Actinopolymorphaceae bacterium]|nr:hypothetical protein [Actinopolymorphaceae bacterium]
MAGAAEPPTTAAPSSASSDDAYTVERDRPDVRVPFTVKADGEALLDLRATAPGTDWAVKGKESAVVSVFVDARYATDVVVTGTAP